jgi:uncharacterized protein (TIGR00251 family)
VIRSLADGVIIDVRVVPRARKSEIAGTRGGALLVRLNAPPVDGAANAELIDVLAAKLQVTKRSLSIVSGETSRQKRVQVTGLDIDTAAARLNR